MPSFPPITVRHPQPYDLVDDPIAVCGVGTGFEARIGARVRDASGTQVAQVFVSAGGTGSWGNYHLVLPLGTIPTTPQGTLEVFGAAGREGVEVGKVTLRPFGASYPFHPGAVFNLDGDEVIKTMLSRINGAHSDII